MISVSVTITDTFGGEPNFSWVNRLSFEMPENCTNRQVLKKIRSHFGISCRLKKDYDLGNELKYNFSGQCVTMFITFE